MNPIHRRTLWLTSLVCLLPMVFSLAIYSKLPQEIAIHWNSFGEADRYAHRAFAAFGLPALMLLLQLVTKAVLLSDPKRQAHSRAMRLLSLWMIPVLSCVMVPVTLLIAMEVNIPISRLITAPLGILLIVCGNYLPKCRQNYTMGIKLPWTLHDAENWNKTHRFAGRLWMICGLAISLTAFMRMGSHLVWLAMALALIMVLVPCAYSYLLYRRSSAA